MRRVRSKEGIHLSIDFRSSYQRTCMCLYVRVSSLKQLILTINIFTSSSVHRPIAELLQFFFLNQN